MRRLTLFLAAVSLVLVAQKAPCHTLALSAESPSVISLKYEEIGEEGPIERSIRTGRFLSVDPVLDQKKALKMPQMWNRYAYALNNPLRYTDPDGKLVRSAADVDEEIKRRNLAQERAALAVFARQLAVQVKSGNLDSKVAIDRYFNKARELTKGTRDATMNALIVATGAALTVRGAVGNDITRPSMGADTLHHYFINATNTYGGIVSSDRMRIGVPVWAQSFGANVFPRWEDDARDFNANNFGAVFGDVLQGDQNALPSTIMP